MLVLQISQSVVFQFSARFDEEQFVVDEKVGYSSLGLNKKQQPFGNAGRQIQHRSQHHAFREFLKGFFHSLACLGAGSENYKSRLLQLFKGLWEDFPALL